MIWWYVFILLQLGDVITTYIALKVGCEEVGLVGRKSFIITIFIKLFSLLAIYYFYFIILSFIWILGLICIIPLIYNTQQTIKEVYIQNYNLRI